MRRDEERTLRNKLLYGSTGTVRRIYSVHGSFLIAAETMADAEAEAEDLFGRGDLGAAWTVVETDDWEQADD